MKNNILKTLSNNLIFKILAVMFAFTLWLIVYNLEDPTKTITMSLQVSVINKESVESLNKYFEVVDGTNKVTFSITAPRSVLEKLDESDFSAVADMEYLTIDEDGVTGSAPIEIKCVTNTAEPVKLSSTNKTLRVELEDLMSKQFVVTPQTVGKVAEGHALGTVTVTAPNVLKVSGPESIVKKVSAVVATIDVGGMAVNVTDSVVPVLYDSNGKEIDTTRLTLSNTTVNVSANILKTKEVPIIVKTSGSPAAGYVIKTVTGKPASIELKGSTQILNTINAIEIPGELVNIEAATEDVTVSIDITEYIPYGAELMDKEDANVTIVVSIGKLREKVFSLATDNIMITGIPTGVDYRFVHSSVAVKISALEEDMNKLSNTMLIGSIDVTGLPEGEHQVTLSLDIDGMKYTYEDVKVSIIIGDDPIEWPDNNEPGQTEPGGENPDSGESDGDNSESDSDTTVGA